MKYLLMFLFLVAALGCFAVYHYRIFNDGLLHVIFCDVGQGDAILIKTPRGKYILIDGGPDKKVLTCLGNNMPFWHRTIDLVLLSHPHLDHFYGLNYVLDRYSVLSFGTEKLDNKTASYQSLKKTIAQKQIPQRVLFAGDVLTLGEVTLRIVSPSKAFLAETSPNGQVGEGKEFASLLTQLSYGSFDVLFTGDSQAAELQRSAERIVQKIDVLQVPHHGSATGLTISALKAINPTMAAISVGQKNRYGHPRKSILQLLTEDNAAIARTDQLGDIEVLSDGKTWHIR